MLSILNKITALTIASIFIPVILFSQKDSSLGNWQKKLFDSSDVVLPLLIETAIKNASEIENLNAAKEVGEYDLKIIKAQNTSGIRVNGAYNYGTFNNFLNNDPVNPFNIFSLSARPQYTTGISVGISLEQLITRKSRINKQLSVIKQAETQQKLGEREIRIEVINLYQELILAKGLLEHSEAAYQSAVILKDLTDKQFKGGDIQVAEQMTINDLYVRAATSQEQARSRYKTALLLLEERIGTTLNLLINKK